MGSLTSVLSPRSRVARESLPPENETTAGRPAFSFMTRFMNLTASAILRSISGRLASSVSDHPDVPLDGGTMPGASDQRTFTAIPLAPSTISSELMRAVPEAKALLWRSTTRTSSPTEMPSLLETTPGARRFEPPRMGLRAPSSAMTTARDATASMALAAGILARKVHPFPRS
ncbi:MAG: hypothetical protein A4E31_00432 [Methanomassiliicoccales archaeon PtaU1.Bin030]|nr:MAG: hypothetical protein A4E31_00432 [Methanomassiliicoccales archaeon PtaU1.Bin030]